MTLLSQKERVPDEEMELLSAIATQAAIAIENARLFEVVARGKREWEATFDSVTEGIYLIDQNYTIIRANKAMAEGLGTRPQALIGRKCYQAVHQLKEPWSECPLQEALQTQQAITSELEDPNTGRTLQITAFM
jgi:PAS domain S-box-containing protein